MWYSGSKQPAVAGISFTVPRAECFGLLGVNGAGKTTTFRILTGFLSPSKGSAILGGKDVVKERGWQRLRGSSYCPQEDALFDLLTGGNKRKLQFALAMLDYTSVIFLDEPTTGMDPGARRKAWATIRRAVRERGCSVVLTSHSMEECEALCDRLVIMVAGRLHCIGSVQYLKSKFGNKYNFKVKLRSDLADLPAELAAVRDHILGVYRTARVVEEHLGMIVFEINVEKIALSQLLQTLNECHDRFPVVDYSVSQVTLEQVFIEMARKQEAGTALKAPPDTKASSPQDVKEEIKEERLKEKEPDQNNILSISLTSDTLNKSHDQEGRRGNQEGKTPDQILSNTYESEKKLFQGGDERTQQNAFPPLDGPDEDEYPIDGYGAAK